jgi:hypothetical protein
MIQSTEEKFDAIIVGYNELSYNCQVLVNDEYWAHYQLGNQSDGEGCLFSEMLDQWEECDADEEEIIVSTPGISIPEWCGECEVVWRLLKKVDKYGDAEYLEVGTVEDPSSAEAWCRWYNSGFKEEDPETNI